LTLVEREKAVTRLYMSVGEAKLQIEAQMDVLIQEGLTKEVSTLLMDICETTFGLLREA